VSRSLARGSEGKKEGTWRLPASEIERSVAEAAAQLVRDRATVALAAQEAGITGDQLKAVLRQAQAWAEKLESPAEASLALSSLIDRVQLKPTGITVSVKLLAEAPEGGTVALAINRWFPMKLKRRGVEMRLVIEGQRPGGQTDAALLRVIARAHSWFAGLTSGGAASIPKIAAREKLGERYVRRLVRVAFLAPRIVEAVVEGRQPVDLTADRLTVPEDLPDDWETQQKLLGFEFGSSGTAVN
jgi:site-specific DNA recombinase